MLLQAANEVDLTKQRCTCRKHSQHRKLLQVALVQQWCARSAVADRVNSATMASAEAGYAVELQSARTRLKALKDRAAARARARGDIPSQRDALSDAQGASAVTDRTTDANGLADGAPASELQKLIAAFLLDPANGVPLDSHRMHKEVCSVLLHCLMVLQALSSAFASVPAYADTTSPCCEPPASSESVRRGGDATALLCS